MLVTYLRSSSYNNYDFCELQYFITYVLGHRSDSGKKAELGTMVHKVMEVLASLKKNQQDNPRKKYLDIVDDAVGKVRIHKDRLMTDDFVEELAELSLESYKKDSKHNWTKGDRNNVSKLSWQALNHNKGQFDPRLRDILHPEPHFDIPIEEDWAKYEFEDPKTGEKTMGQLAIKGTIDLVTHAGDGIIEVIDWKTGMRKDWATGEVKTYQKLQTDAQLLLYNYAISKLYPEYDQAIMTIFFVKDGGPFSMFFDNTDEEKFLGMLKNRYQEIQANNKPKPLNAARSDWKCSRLCHFYKNNWPGTDKRMCNHVEDTLKSKGMDAAVKELIHDEHSISYYEAPG